MKQKATDQQIIEAWERLGSPSKVARELGMSDRALLTRRAAIEIKYSIKLKVEKPHELNSDSVPSPKPEEFNEIRVLRSKLLAAQRYQLTDEYVKSKIIGLRDSPINPPDWLLQKSDSVPGQHVPTLMLSDLHWGEVVSLRQVNGTNEYDIIIAQFRLRKVIDRAIILLKHHMVSPQYPGIVLALGGDMLSGDIHEELSESNDVPVMPALIDLYGVLVWAIRTLVDQFGQVFVPCVTGNHGRNTRKPRVKGRNFTNFDWLLYQFLTKYFESDNRVQFYVPDGSDAHWSVFGHRYCMTHGDQFRGGDGMIGALGPIIRGDHKKRSRNGQIDLGYDTLLLGHWHQLIQLQRLIVNGSLKGYDEYAAANNFGYEPPQQALWLTHSEKGITFSMPVHVEERKKPVDHEWVKFAAKY